MLYVRDPDDDELQELRRMARQEIGRVSQRAHMVLLSAQGRSVPEIATIFAIHPASVRSWLRRFDLQGPAGLYDAPRSGRPRRLGPADERMLAGLLSADPQTTAGGTNATYWTVAMLTLAMLVRLGSYLCPATLRRSLHRLRLRWGRPRLAMPEKLDPEKARKQWAIAEAVVTAGPQTVVLYADESRVQTLPLVRALWHWVGQQVRIPTPGSNVSRAIFGALEWRTGQTTSSPFSNICCKPMRPVRSC